MPVHKGKKFAEKIACLHICKYDINAKFVLVKVKWGKEMFPDVEVNTEEEPMLFKAQIFALTGVQPERQKVMMKGTTLKDDDWGTIKLKDVRSVFQKVQFLEYVFFNFLNQHSHYAFFHSIFSPFAFFIVIICIDYNKLNVLQESID